MFGSKTEASQQITVRLCGAIWDTGRYRGRGEGQKGISSQTTRFSPILLKKRVSCDSGPRCHPSPLPNHWPGSGNELRQPCGRAYRNPAPGHKPSCCDVTAAPENPVTYFPHWKLCQAGNCFAYPQSAMGTLWASIDNLCFVLENYP